jgi:hypothetical protein
MGVTKISQFPQVTQANSTSVLPIVQDGVTSRILSTDLVPTLYVDVELTSAQILALNTTPVDLITQPINGDRYIIEEIFLKYSFGTTGYIKQGGNFIGLKASYYISAVEDVLSVDSLIFDGSRNYLYSGTGFSSNIPIDAASIKLSAGTAITGGDGTVKVRVYYKVIPSTF